MPDLTTSILWKKGYRLNSRGEWYKPTVELPHPVQKPNLCNGPKREDARKEDSPSSRVRMVITSYRVKLCDIDNLEPKFIIDALRYGMLIVDDSPKFISELSLRQVQVRHFIDEHTEITIEPA